MFMKRMLCMILAIMVILSLAACGGTTPAAATTAATTAAATAAATAETTAAPSAPETVETTKPASGTIKLLICSWFAEDPYLKSGIESFEKDTGMKVALNTVEWNLSSTQFAIAYAAGNSPDVVHLGDWSIRGDIVNDRLYPLNKWINQADLEGTNQGFVDRFSKDGNIYGYIANTDVRLILYNKALFKKAGLPTDIIPETWTQFLDILPKLNHINGPDQYAYGFIGSGIHAPIMWETLVRSLGGYAIDPDTGKILLGSDATVKAAEFYRTILEKGYASSACLGDDGTGLVNEFISGNYAIILGGSWMYRDIIKGEFKADDLGYAKIPRADKGKLATISGAWSMCISSATKMPDVSWNLINSIYSEAFFINDIKANKAVPTRKKYLPNIDEEYTKWLTNYSFDDGQAELHSQFFLEDIDSLTKALDSAISGKSDIKADFDKVSAEINQKHEIQ